MITKEDIKNLANLARIDVGEEEMESLAKDIDSILGYVGQIKNATGESVKVIPNLRNVLREDVALHAPNQFTEKLLKNAPSREKNFLKVKKIL